MLYGGQDGSTCRGSVTNFNRYRGDRRIYEERNEGANAISGECTEKLLYCAGKGPNS